MPLKNQINVTRDHTNEYYVVDVHASPMLQPVDNVQFVVVR